jgi:hypothetical protein
VHFLPDLSLPLNNSRSLHLQFRQSNLFSHIPSDIGILHFTLPYAIVATISSHTLLSFKSSQKEQIFYHHTLFQQFFRISFVDNIFTYVFSSSFSNLFKLFFFRTVFLYLIIFIYLLLQYWGLNSVSCLLGRPLPLEE